MKNKKLDIIGIAAGVFLVLVLLLNIVAGNANARANEPKIPAGAQTYATSAQGIFSEVKLETVADADGIYSVKVVEHGETPELGGVAAEELPAKILEAQSVDVDGVAGATMTSNAIKTAVTEALVQAGFMEAPVVEEPAAEESAVEEAAAVESAAEVPEAGQVYETSAQGIFSEVKVRTVADENTIYSVEVIEHGETEGIGSVAAAELPAKIVEAQSVDVDGVAGATMTSNAIKAAVTEALTEAGFLGGAEEEAPAEEVTKAADAEVPADAQTLTASAQGIFSEVKVEVVADENGIYDVKVVEHGETEGIGSVAAEELPAKIVAAQSTDIDGMAGATMTSNAIKTAVASALAEAGIDPANFSAPAAAEEEAVVAEDMSYDVDVVVVGAGGAGMTAAISAKDEGLNVLVLESQALVGGNSVRSTGGMNAGKTEWQDANDFDQAAGVEATLAKVPNYADNERIQELAAIVEEQWAEYQANPEGYFDSVELFQLDTLIGGGGLNDPALVKTLAENSAAAIEWLGELDPEVILHNVAAFGGASVKRIHRPVDADGKVLSVGAYVVPLLKENLESRGIELLLNTTAKEILVDENGAACGVVATGANGETVTVNAKAVVITTGGFGANNDMIASIRPELDGFITTNAPGIQGQGIQMAQAIGADTVDLEQIQLHPTVHVQDGSASLITEGLRGDGAILVNQEGERFFDEVSTRDKVSNAEFAQTGGYAWLIIDSRMSDASNVIQGYINKGFAESGETYEELAEAIGTPADVFAATMEKWNECVAAKEDADFNRVSFANPLDQAPYYAIKVQPGIHHTMGGIKIDSAAQVIDTEGNVIPGLFAAGEVTGGVHGNNRLGGNAVADFTIFGRIAGNSAAAYVSGEPAAEVATEEAAPAAAAGEPQTLTASAQGIFSEVKVEVVADENGIYDVKVVEHGETEGIGSVAAEELPAKIVAAQSTDIDGMAGATMTSNAIKTAVASALAEAGIDPANFSAPAAAEEEAVVAEDMSYDVDVVVVGAGGAGMTAAISAKDEGLNVLVLESQALVGGNSVRSTGGMNAGKTEWQDANDFDQAAGVEATLAKVPNYADNERIQELAAIVEEQWAEYQANPEGYFDSVELFQLDTLIGGGGLNDPALVKTLAENSAAAIEWLGELDPEVILHNVAAFGGASVKRIHRPVDADGKVLSVGAYVVPLLKENLESRGIELLLNTTAKEILVDENGAACGVVATGANGETVTVNAKAVVITTGGFGANNDMIASIRPELDGFITTNAPGIQGQGIQMAQAIGADTVDLEQIQLHPTVHVQDGSASLITEGLRGDGAILVNQEGERFFDEVSTRDKVSNAEFAQTGGYAWLIIDSRMSDASNVIQGYINKGFAESGETYEELAEAIGTPADVFAATMEKWNECVAAKEDADFNRVSFANPLDQAPYYAIKVQPGIHHTMGGIKIDSAAQVIDTEGNVIPGLFAAGEVTGGVHGNNRLGGNAVADFTIFGRIAGGSAAAYVSGEPATEVATEEAAEETAAAEGETFTAAAESLLNNEDVYVTITVLDGEVVAVDVDTSSQSTDYGAAAEPDLEAQILAANGGPIDGVSGATLTSMAVKEAYADVLAQAGLAS